MSPRTGRPTSDPKINQYRIRLSDKEIKMLEYCCEKTGLSKSDVVRRGIEKMYNELQAKK
jgi:predicted DNA-binding protein